MARDKSKKLTVADILYKGSYNVLIELDSAKKAVVSTVGVNIVKVVSQLDSFNSKKPFYKKTVDAVAETVEITLLTTEPAKATFARLLKIAKSVFEPALDF